MLKAKVWAVGAALVLLSGVAAIGASVTIAAQASAATQPRTVPIDCSQDGGDARTTVDASVQPGVIVADTSGWPYSPVTYTPFSIDDTGHLQVIGPWSTIATTNHLVAVWQDSTDCFGNSDSRNAWVTDSSGGVFGENDLSGPPADNLGGMLGQHLNQPMVGMSPTADANGYWLVASDGGIFAFGDAGFHGSLGGQTLSAPIAGMIPNGNGYTLIGQDGQLYPFS